MQQAINELKRLIIESYPDAAFEMFDQDDPVGVGLRITVDVDEMYPVMEPLMDTLYEFQVEHVLPISPSRFDLSNA